MTHLKDIVVNDSPAARLNALALMPEIARVSLIAAKARDMDASWMRVIEQSGVLAYEHDPAQPKRLQEAKDALHPWMKRVTACLYFLSKIEGAPRPEKPIPGTKNDEFDISHMAVLNAGNDFKEWFAGAAQGITATVQALRQNSEWQFSSTLRDSVKEVAGQWLMGACALDLPDMARAMMDACRESRYVELPHPRLGKFLTDETMSSTTGLLVNAAYVALQLSRGECLRVLDRDQGQITPRFELGSVPRDQGSDDSLGLFDAKFAPVCDQATFAIALELAQRHPESRELLEDCAVKSLRDTAEVNMSSYVPAFTANGAYARVGFTAAQVACVNGHVGVLQSMGGAIRWSTDDQRQSAVIYDALGSYNESNKKDIRGALNAFARMAVAEGGADAIFTFEGKVRDDAVNMIVQHQAVDLLVMAMDNTKLRPDTVVEFHNNDRATLAEYAARLVDTRVANALRSWSARSTAHALLDELDAAPSAKASP